MEKTSPKGESYFTLHQKSSLIAVYIMLIHAVVIETIGIHWLIHGKSPVISVILLILNIYTVIYFIGEIQAVRLNPLSVKDKKLYVSLGMGKRMVIPFAEMEKIHWGKEAAEFNLKSKELITFIAKDFEEVPPHCVIEFRKPLEASMLYGLKKHTRKRPFAWMSPNALNHFFIKRAVLAPVAGRLMIMPVFY